MTPVVDAGHIESFLDDYGPMLDLVPSFKTQDGKVLAPCWGQHPPAHMELSGIYLAWSQLQAAYRGELQVVPGPRDWLDLTNATVHARDRAIAATRNCHRAGKHVEESAT